MNKEDVRIVFMGTPDFAIPTIEAIVKSGYNVVGVITAPDRQSGRGRKIKTSAVKDYALEHNLNILQPTNLKDKEFINELSLLEPNLQVVVAFRMLPEIVWSMPKLGTFNLHASLLPQYRGAAPINYALINGDSETGLTTFFLDKEIDTGRIIEQISEEILPDDNVGSLHDRLMKKGAQLVLSTIEKIISGNISTIDQRSIKEDLRPAPKLTKEGCRIDWSQTSVHINNFIRGLSPYPAAISNLVTKDGIQINTKIYDINIVENDSVSSQPGSIITDSKEYLHVRTGDGIVSINEIQQAGKKRMKIVDFLRGQAKIQEFRFG